MHNVQRTDGRYSFISTVAANPGDVIVRPCTTLSILDGLEPIRIGDLISPEPLVPSNIVEFDAPSAATWSAGAQVYWDNTNRVLTTTASGNTLIGRSIRAKTNGQLISLINCISF